MRSRRERRRRAQAGTTLIELLVTLMIIGLAVLVLVGSLSTGVLDATLAKRNTAANAAIEYEVEKIGAAPYTSPPQPYSECFAIDTAASPGECRPGMNLRADVTASAVHPGVQQWTVQVRNYPSLDVLGAKVSVYKVDR